MPIPTWKKHIPKALWENIKYNKKLPKQTLNNYNLKTKKMYDNLKKFESENFILYPVSSYFCNKECYFVESTGEPIYFDEGHLTLTGSNRLLGLFESIIIDGEEFINKH